MELAETPGLSWSGCIRQHWRFLDACRFISEAPLHFELWLLALLIKLLFLLLILLLRVVVDDIIVAFCCCGCC